MLHQYKTVVDNQPASLQVKPAFKTILKDGNLKKKKNNTAPPPPAPPPINQLTNHSGNMQYSFAFDISSSRSSHKEIMIGLPVSWKELGHNQ